MATTINKKTVNRLIADFLKGKSENTQKQYLNDLKSFSDYLILGTIGDAVSELLHYPESQANLTILHYKNQLLLNHSRKTTINRKISTIRSLVKSAKKRKIVDWEIDIPSYRIEKSDVQDEIDDGVLEEILNIDFRESQNDKAARDIAILRLIYDMALNRNILAKLNLEDINLERSEISINYQSGKKQVKAMPQKTKECLKKWINARGKIPGPLFTNFDHANKGKRLTETSIYRIVRDLGKSRKIQISPMKVRKKAVKEVVAQASAADIPADQALSYLNHKNEAVRNRRFAFDYDLLTALPKFSK